VACDDAASQRQDSNPTLKIRSTIPVIKRMKTGAESRRFTQRR
jgi:hypothetical protein